MVTGNSGLILTHKPFVMFNLPSPAEEWSDRATLVGTWHSVGINPTHHLSYPENSNLNIKEKRHRKSRNQENKN